jgi:hypothetical protein
MNHIVVTVGALVSIAYFVCRCLLIVSGVGADSDFAVTRSTPNNNKQQDISVHTKTTTTDKQHL